MSPRILLLAHDNKIGDSIILTGVLKPILEKFPKAELGILCGESNYQIYKYNPNVKKIYKSLNRSILARLFASFFAKFTKYDYLVYFGLDIDKSSFGIITFFINAKKRILFSSPRKKRPEDIILNGDWSNKHLSERHQKFIEWITKTKPKKYFYDIYLNPAKTYLPKEKCKNNNPKITINIFGSNSNNTLSLLWTRGLLEKLKLVYPESTIQLLSPSINKQHILESAFNLKKLNLKIIPYKKELCETLNEIRLSDVVITTDTYASHASSAWNIPVLVLYGMNALRDKHPVIFGPKSDTHSKLIPNHKNVESIRYNVIINALKFMLAHPGSKSSKVLKN
jgi:ADP-heptose:LPS heptosyltransferase